MAARNRAAPEHLILYLDRSEIRDGRIGDLQEGIRKVVALVEQQEPQLIEYGFYIDHDPDLMTVTAVHPDSASLEFHLEVGNKAFRQLGEMIVLREIEVYGSVSDRARQMLEQKVRMLGGTGFTVHEKFAGFARQA